MSGILVIVLLGLAVFLAWHLTHGFKTKKDKQCSEKRKKDYDSFLLIQNIPNMIFFINAVILLINIDFIKNKWDFILVLLQVVIAAVNVHFLDYCQYNARHTKMPDGSYELKKIHKTLIYIFSYSCTILWIIFIIRLFINW